MRKIFLFILGTFYSLGVLAQGSSSDKSWLMNGVIPSLVSDDHTAEGTIINFHGTLIHFFRLDPGILGNHIGNNAYIAKRQSFDNGLTWTLPEMVYDNEYDNRNVSCHLLDNDTIILTYRDYNAQELLSKGSYVIYSGDGGVTWTDPEIISDIYPGSIVYSFATIPGEGYLFASYKLYYVELHFSFSGMEIDSSVYVWNYLADHKYNISEPSFAYLGNGVIVGLFRCAENPYLFVISNDMGRTWSDPVFTNVSNGGYSVSPLIFYDDEEDEVWVVASERRGGDGVSIAGVYSECWLYNQPVEDLLLDNGHFMVYGVFERPFPNILHFYGYPTFSKLDDSKFLVVFTESFKKMNNNEQADFYQFELEKEKVVGIGDNFITPDPVLTIYPNPCNDYLKIKMPVEGVFSDFNLYDAGGRFVEQIQANNLNDGIIFHRVDHLSPGTYSLVYTSDLELKTARFIISHN